MPAANMVRRQAAAAAAVVVILIIIAAVSLTWAIHHGQSMARDDLTCYGSKDFKTAAPLSWEEATKAMYPDYVVAHNQAYLQNAQAETALRSLPQLNAAKAVIDGHGKITSVPRGVTLNGPQYCLVT